MINVDSKGVYGYHIDFLLIVVIYRSMTDSWF
jgi:hypothetical protein